jgi:hypothetical protein
MKKLLLLSSLFLGSFVGFAQDDCATAIPITSNGTVNAPAITGVFSTTCYNNLFDNTGTGDMFGVWYSYTPTESGEVNITSNLPSNVAPQSVDTKVSIFTGDCAVLTCYASNDDINPAATGGNYLSNLTFPVVAGTTYYIQWDNYWDGANFDFDLTFTPISCLKVYTVNLPTNTTTTSITLNWSASLSAPGSYDVEYGPTGFVQGSGTTVSSSTNSLDLTSLTAETIYDFYVRSNCGATQSVWTAVNRFTTAKTCPEASGFDNTNQLVGWTISGNNAQGLGTTAANAQSPAQYWIFNNTVGAATNNWLFTPAFFLNANEQVTISFWERNATAAGNRSLRVTVGNAATSAAQTTVIYSNAALLNNTYAQITTPVYTAPSSGIYYFAFNDNSAAATTAAAATMRFDTVNFTSVLRNDEFLASNFSVFPNPANDIVTVTSNDIVIDSIEFTDINGRTVKNVNTIGSNESQINISDLAQGVYMMKITSDKGTATKKLVVE